MTYKELAEEILKCNPEQLLQTVTVCINDEYYGIRDLGVSIEDDILDSNHLVLIHEEALAENIKTFQNRFDTTNPIRTIREVINRHIPIGLDQYGENPNEWVYITDITPNSVITLSNGRQYFPHTYPHWTTGDPTWFPSEQKGDMDCIILTTDSIVHGS